MVETAMILPWLFLIIFGITELTLYLYARNVVHYAAFMAARSFMVHGHKNLGAIDYPYNKEKEIIKATAEKIIFESLPWEHKRIQSKDPKNPVDRYYTDQDGEFGAVRVKASSANGMAEMQVIYCLPVLFSLEKYFIPEDLVSVCSNITASDGVKQYNGIPIIHKVELLENL